MPAAPMRYEDWDIPDPARQPLEVVRDIRDDIQGPRHRPPARHPRLTADPGKEPVP